MEVILAIGITVGIVALLACMYTSYSQDKLSKDAQMKIETEQAYRQQQTENAQMVSDVLKIDLEKCLREQRAISLQLKYEESVCDYVSVYIALFSEFDVVGLDIISNYQREQLEAKRNELDAKIAAEKELRVQIATPVYY